MNKITCNNIPIYQFENIYINSNMYILIDGAKALVIDPHENSEAKKFLSKNNIKNTTILLTHEHFDHTMGLKWFKDNYDTCTICTEACSDAIDENIQYAPIFVSYIASTKDEGFKTKLLNVFKKEFKPFSFKADIVFDKEYEFIWQSIKIRLLNISGHSKGSSLIFLNEKLLFSGDSILKDIPIVTKLPGGNKKFFLNSTIPVLESLDRTLIVLPGHGNKFILSELFTNDKIQLIFK